MIDGLVQYPGVGCVIEFMLGNAPQLAIVLEERNGRLRLLLPNRRETTLPVGRILPWPGPVHDHIPTRDAALELLEQHRMAREASVFDPHELWSIAQGEVDKALAQWFAELAMDNPDVDAVAACGRALLQAKVYFKFNSPYFEVYPESVVIARIAEQEKTRKRESIVNRGGEFIRLLWERYQKKSPAMEAVCAAAAVLEDAVRDRLKRIILDRIADPDKQEDEVLWRMLVKGIPADSFLPLYLAEAWGLVQPHHNFWLDRAGYAHGDSWSAAFRTETDALLQQICSIESAPTDEALPLISIDAPTTRDVDDAFYIVSRPEGGWKLTLALACPAGWWPFGSPLDRAVFRRATSIYLPEGIHHMLPECLGTEGYSLLAGTTRPAMLVRCVVEADGSVTACEPSLGSVRLAANLCYSDCEAALGGQQTLASPYLEQLQQALRLARVHQARRIRQGAVIIERPDQVIRLEGQGEAVRVVLEENPPVPCAHLLVSELMVLINAQLPRWAGERGVTLLYRTQDVNVPKEFAGIWKTPLEIAQVVRALAPAILETTARPHVGLGETVYAPCTSPLRRYPDMLNEAQILHYLSTGVPRWNKAELDGLLPLLNARLDAAGQVQRSRLRYWKLLYFRQQGDKVWWPAVITDENEAFVTVNLPREQLIVRAKRSLFGDRHHPGQELKIRLGKVHPLQNDFHLLEAKEV